MCSEHGAVTTFLLPTLARSGTPCSVAGRGVRICFEISRRLSQWWSAAESDLERFAYAGSLIGAIASVTQDAGQKAAGAKQQVQDIKTGKFRDAANSTNSRLLHAYLRPGGTVNADNKAKLEQWMTENAISTAPGMMTMFLNVDIFESARAKAVRDLGLDKSP